jgi:hypothetical protein
MPPALRTRCVGSVEPVTRIDGWIGAEDRIPTPVAEIIARAAPSYNPKLIAIIRARMVARQLAYEQTNKLGWHSAKEDHDD